MAKKSAVARNNKRIKMAESYSKKRAKLKAIVMNRDLPMEERFEAQMKLSKLPRNSSRCRIRNRCGLSGRPRGVYRKFRLSRIALRDLASVGLIPGVTKSSW